MVQLPYRTLDVFTDTRFGGNPLAVVLGADALATAEMQAVAREFGYSETTFVCAPGDPAHDAKVRIFTPTFEMPFAGHPNVGTGWVLAGETGKDRLVFEEIAGLVPIAVTRENGRMTAVSVSAPEPLSVGETGSVETVAETIGLAPEDIETDVHAPCTASVGAAFTVVELASRDALKRMQVADTDKLASLGGLAAIYAYVRDADGADISARMIFDADGLREDPATGSATAACAALIHSLTGETGLVFAQGVDMGRPSRIRTRVDERGVTIGGACVSVMSGTITVRGRSSAGP